MMIMSNKISFLKEVFVLFLVLGGNGVRLSSFKGAVYFTPCILHLVFCCICCSFGERRRLCFALRNCCICRSFCERWSLRFP